MPFVRVISIERDAPGDVRIRHHRELGHRVHALRQRHLDALRAHHQSLDGERQARRRG